MKKKGKSYLIGVHIDFFGSMNMDPEDEFKDVVKILKSKLPNLNLKFKFFEALHEVEGQPVDVYIIDYGGLCAQGALGFQDTVDSTYHQYIQTLISERPSMLVVFWSQMSSEKYADYVEEEVKDLGANVVVWDHVDDNKRAKVIERIKVQLGVY